MRAAISGALVWGRLDPRLRGDDEVVGELHQLTANGQQQLFSAKNLQSP